MNRRALPYIIGCLICAVGAVFLVHKLMLSNGGGGKPPVEEVPTVKVAMVIKPIEYGTKLVEKSAAEDKDKANVRFKEWPEKHVPKGAITSPEEFNKHTYFAGRDYITRELLLKEKLLTEDQVVPEGMFYESILVDKDEAQIVGPGDWVDILRITGKREVEPFLLCVRICSKGLPPTEGKSEESSRRLFFLLPRELREMVIEAKLKSSLMVKPRGPNSCEGETPRVPEKEPQKDPGVAFARMETADALYEDEQYRAARLAYTQVIKEFPALPLAKKARQRIEQCTTRIAEGKLERVKAAFEHKEYRTAISLAQELKEEFPEQEKVVSRAEDSIEQAEAQLAAGKKEKQYRELVSRLQEALDGGNIPKVKELGTQLKEEYENYEVGGGLKSPEEVLRNAEQRLRGLEMQFSKEQRVLQHWMKSERQDKAVEKLEEMKEVFPDHPYVQEQEEKMVEKGWIQ